MKKKILIALATVVVLFSVIFTGCSGGVSQSKYDQIVDQLADAESQLTQCQSDLAASQQDLAALQTEKDDLDSLYQDTVSQLSDVTQQLDDLRAQYEYVGMTKAEIAEQIVINYEASHLYEKDVYDCNNMASDVWNMLKAQGIDAVIVVGSVEHVITDILQSDHAWVLAEVAPGEFLALDATIGHAFTPDTGSRYFRGWTFASPADLKANDDLRTEYNTRVLFIYLLNNEANIAANLYNNSTSQAEADKWLALYNKLLEIRDGQDALLDTLMSQILALATEL
jgi:outer membrane murein-binding lipoprotein Lpp